MKKVLIVLVIFVAMIIGRSYFKENCENVEERKSNLDVTAKNVVSIENNQLDDWRIILVNYENKLPEDYQIELKNIDETRKFDARAIEELFSMMRAMKKDGITNIWVQSSYRSVERQRELFDEKVKKYVSQGKSKEEAENLTLETINKPGTSEHNLGLAVDFNYVDYNFDKVKGFKWLKENAEKYGFIMRYRKDKENITKVTYEPWHWRYVGEEHAKKINELDFCLEEYVEFLKEDKNK